jgi:hypothetical protein
MNTTERARLAEEALRNEIFDEAVMVLEQNLIAEWKVSPPDNWKSREATYNKLQALMDIKAQLQTFLDTAALETTAKGKHGRSSSYNV